MGKKAISHSVGREATLDARRAGHYANRGVGSGMIVEEGLVLFLDAPQFLRKAIHGSLGIGRRTVVVRVHE